MSIYSCVCSLFASTRVMYIFTGGLAVSNFSAAANVPAVLTDLGCIGNETNLADCITSASGVFSNLCETGDAAVICHGAYEGVELTKIDVQLQIRPHITYQSRPLNQNTQD